MKLDPDQRSLLTDLMAESYVEAEATHDGMPPTADVAAAYVGKVEALMPAGFAWVDGVLREMTVEGAKRVFADWRRSHVHQGEHHGRSRVLPAFAGVQRSIAGDSAPVHIQLRLAGMDLPALQEHRDKLARQALTLDHRVSFIDDLIAIMKSDPTAYPTVGDALVAAFDDSVAS